MPTLFASLRLDRPPSATSHQPPVTIHRKAPLERSQTQERHTQQVAHFHNRNWQLALLLGIRTAAATTETEQTDQTEQTVLSYDLQVVAEAEDVVEALAAVGAGMTT